VTNIGNNHLGQFGTQQDILETKLTVIKELRKDGVALLNADDDLLRQYKSDKPIIYYGIVNEAADYRAVDIIVGKACIDFRVTHGDKSTPIHLSTIEKMNVYNALVAFAIGDLLGMKSEVIQKKLGFYKTDSGGLRQNFMNIGGYSLYIDCFNSSPQSVLQMVDDIDAMPRSLCGKRYVVLGDINDLGDGSETIHRDLGRDLAQRSSLYDKAFCFGFYSKSTAESLRAAGVDCFYSDDREELEHALVKTVKRGDLICWKASHGVELSRSIDRVFGTDLSYLNLCDEGRVMSDAARYIDLSGVAQLDKYLGSQVHMAVPARIKDSMVTAVGRMAFYNTKIKSLFLPSSIIVIGTGAFKLCYLLRQVVLSDGLKVIGDEAFNACLSLTEMLLPQTCTHIGRRAFYNCENLRSLFLPTAVGRIEEEAFAKCPQLELVCPEDSYAAKYAGENGLRFRIAASPYEPNEMRKWSSSRKANPSHQTARLCFVDAMNYEAQQMGMCRSRFLNTHGLQAANQVSTAEDLLLLGIRSLGYPDLLKALTAESQTIHIRGLEERQVLTRSTVRQYGKALYSIYKVVLGKTGTLNKSDGSILRNLFSVVETPDGNWVAAVVLDSGIDRYKVTKLLLDSAIHGDDGQIGQDFDQDYTAAAVCIVPQRHPFGYKVGDIPLLLSKNVTMKVQPASLVKLLTAMVMLDTMDSLNDSFEILSDDMRVGNDLDLKTGDRISFRDALYYMMLPSSNTAAAAVARVIGEKLL
jgi:hypothetical protein